MHLLVGRSPPGGEARARALNDRADQAARLYATRRAQGSARASCVALREEAAKWEVEAVTALANVRSTTALRERMA